MDDVERVARAIQAASRTNVDPDKLTPTPSGGKVVWRPVWTIYENMAIAAIKEMRDPSVGMAVAGFSLIGQ